MRSLVVRNADVRDTGALAAQAVGDLESDAVDASVAGPLRSARSQTWFDADAGSASGEVSPSPSPFSDSSWVTPVTLVVIGCRPGRSPRSA